MSFKNILVGQSGGQTAAINATLAGIIKEGIENPEIGTVYGMVNGIKGALSDNLINLSEFFSDTEKLNLLKQTPSAFLGSCRYKLSSFEADSKYFSASSLTETFILSSINGLVINSSSPFKIELEQYGFLAFSNRYSLKKSYPSEFGLIRVRL